MNYLYCNQEKDICTEYLDSHLCGGIKVKNIDKLLDIIDEVINIKEYISNNPDTLDI